MHMHMAVADSGGFDHNLKRGKHSLDRQSCALHHEHQMRVEVIVSIIEVLHMDLGDNHGVPGIDRLPGQNHRDNGVLVGLVAGESTATPTPSASTRGRRLGGWGVHPESGDRRDSRCAYLPHSLGFWPTRNPRPGYTIGLRVVLSDAGDNSGGPPAVPLRALGGLSDGGKGPSAVGEGGNERVRRGHGGGHGPPLAVGRGVRWPGRTGRPGDRPPSSAAP